MLNWLKDVKADARRRTDGELMHAIDMLDLRVPKNKSEAKAIELTKEVYWYELQERNWASLD